MAIETILKENRSFPPPPDFKKKAILNDKYIYEQLWDDAQENPEKFWEKAAHNIHWFKKWNKTLSWNPPHAEWFIGGETNASYQCLDQQIKAGKKDKLAIVYESENGEVQKYTYGELLEKVNRLASSMQKELGLQKGNAVAIYMPLIPEAIMTMLACARLGVTHTVIFAGFSAQAISDRVLDADCQYVFTCDVANRKGQELSLLKTTLQAVENLEIVKKVVVFNRKNSSLTNKCIEFSSLPENQPKQDTTLWDIRM
jgi:acetyl-CoA synthetase